MKKSLEQPLASQACHGGHHHHLWLYRGTWWRWWALSLVKVPAVYQMERVWALIVSPAPARTYDGSGYDDYLTSSQTSLLSLPGRSPTLGWARAGSPWRLRWSSVTGSVFMAWCPQTSAGRTHSASAARGLQMSDSRCQPQNVSVFLQQLINVSQVLGLETTALNYVI